MQCGLVSWLSAPPAKRTKFNEYPCAKKEKPKVFHVLM
jgi:hypothetical protein